MPHHANIVLLGTAVLLLVLQFPNVQLVLSLCEAKQTALSVLLDTCVRHPNKGLYVVRLAPQHLARQENRFAPIVLQDISVPTQSKCFYCAVTKRAKLSVTSLFLQEVCGGGNGVVVIYAGGMVDL